MSEISVNNDFLRFFPFSDPKVQVDMSLRSLGDMSDPEGEPRRRFYEGTGLSARRVFTLQQVHSRRIVYVDGSDLPVAVSRMEGDGLISRDPSLALGVTVADCLPMFLFHAKSGTFAALHSGWRGTGIVADALEAFRANWAIAPDEVEAFIGPSIGGCCYRVDEKRALDFSRRYGDAVLRKDGREFYLDLGEVNERLLRNSGVRQLVREKSCTSCDDRFGSYRREGPEAFHRMLALIAFFR
ncbi:polyphenol oxidase family protein [Sediminispirochaeta bajacaliforniensis]|uniref:polyphenol oxidase family protein n=1 Tax=Sediminispirochaeta bajacaliforniensis TaxID=148 RepID=UPI000364D00F|nr:polyphenol oxidase family protein [Sediminispirochaeta bajacaliforniensis]